MFKILVEESTMRVHQDIPCNLSSDVVSNLLDLLALRTLAGAFQFFHIAGEQLTVAGNVARDSHQWDCGLVGLII